MKHVLFAAAVTIGIAGLAAGEAGATASPDKVATVVVHGFDPSGASTTGVFGNDQTTTYITEMAVELGLPTSDVDPTAPNQVAYTTYYGDQYPAYYTAQDIQDIQNITTTHGGGVPRYAAIVAKFAEHVMERSGAEQVNIFAVSFGGLISRYMIEKDVEGLASTDKIARWIAVEGVVAGNYGATYGGPVFEDFYEEQYGAPPIDLQHMDYEWVEANIHNPRQSSASPFLGEFPTHFWLASDDNFNERALTFLSGKANDGVVLTEDAKLTSLPPQSLYLGLEPTVSTMHTNHESTKDFEGIRAGVAAQLFGRKRVTITLEQVRVRNEFDGSARGDGEYVFGLRVFSPQAESLYGITNAIHQVRADDASIPFVRMAQDTTVTVNMTWFDDMVLPGETALRLQTNVDEVDGDIIYNISEALGEVYEDLADTTVEVNIEAPGTYTLETDDWRAVVGVTVTEYPPYDGTETAAQGWELYE